jgi:branched-chain amino acid transport system ATP-binding protein
MKILTLDRISKNFGGLQALSSVSFEAKTGERLAIIGPNGAGKTTLFSIISGGLLPTSGSIYLFEENINRSPMHRRAHLGISQTFQVITLFRGLTVLENAVLSTRSLVQVRYSLFRPLNRHNRVISEAEEILKAWGLWEDRNTKVSDLSYGDQRLLDISLAMAKKPRLLLLDEPTSGLALSEIPNVVSKIKALTREITVLLIEHNMDVALNLADNVVVLQNGQVVAGGPPAVIRQNPRVNEIYLGTKKQRAG